MKEAFDKDFKKRRDGVYTPFSGGLLIVKADWCGHCRRALPELEEVSKLTGEMFPIYKLDADTNKKAVDLLEVQGFPSIFFIERDGKVFRKYQKERTKRAIVDEICSVMKKCF